MNAGFRELFDPGGVGDMTAQGNAVEVDRVVTPTALNIEAQGKRSPDVSGRTEVGAFSPLLASATEGVPYKETCGSRRLLLSHWLASSQCHPPGIARMQRARLL